MLVNINIKQKTNKKQLNKVIRACFLIRKVSRITTSVFFFRPFSFDFKGVFIGFWEDFESILDPLS
jgi:hypothetical protein